MRTYFNCLPKYLNANKELHGSLKTGSSRERGSYNSILHLILYLNNNDEHNGPD